MKITTKLTIDMARRQILEKVDAVQCDANTRAVAVTLTAGGLPWVPGDGLTVSVACKKPDRTSAWYDKLPDGTAACSVAGNVVTAILAPEVLTAAGQVQAAIVFQDASLNQLATFPFVIDVAENPAAGSVISNSYYNLQTLAEVNEAFDSIGKTLAAHQTYMDRISGDSEQNRRKIDEIAYTVGRLQGSLTAVEENTSQNFAATAIICTAEGEQIGVSDSANYPLQSLAVYGKSVQDGTPTPDAPVPIISAGAVSGEINVLMRDKLLIAEQPKDTSVAMGDTAVFTVKAEGKGLTYQWQFFSKYDSAVWTDLAQEGCKTDAINIVAGINNSGYQYRCVVTDANGNQVISKPAFLTIGSTSAITIMEQPKDAVLGLEETAVFTIKAVDVEGFSSAYQWQYRLTTGSGWYNTRTTGANTPELRVPAQENDTVRFGYKYRCVITDGNGNSFCTRTVTLYNRETFTGVNDFPEDAQVLTISTPGGLPGLPVSSGGNYTDENGQMWVADCVGLERGMRVQRVYTGIITAEQIREVNNDYVSIAGAMANISLPVPARTDGKVTLIIMDRSIGVSVEGKGLDPSAYRVYVTSYANASILYPVDAGEITMEQAQTDFVGATYQYVLAEPIETELTDVEKIAYASLRTYRPNTTIVNDAGAGMKVEYVADPKTYIDNKFAELATAMAGS